MKLNHFGPYTDFKAMELQSHIVVTSQLRGKKLGSWDGRFVYNQLNDLPF
jgi:hypothetical protein